MLAKYVSSRRCWKNCVYYEYDYKICEEVVSVERC